MRKLMLVAILGILLPAQVCRAEVEGRGQEIEVTADSWSWTSPDHVRLTLLIEDTSKTSAEALKALDARTTGIVTAMKAIAGQDLIVVPRGDELSTPGKNAAPDNVTAPRIRPELPPLPGNERSAPLDASSPVHIKRHVGVETKALEKTGELIDAALKAGASSVTDVDYSVKDDQASRVKAIEEATVKGKNKAQALAKSLGVSLGNLLSATVTEERDAKTLREKRVRGEDVAANYSDSDSHVFVSLRFGVVANP